MTAPAGFWKRYVAYFIDWLLLGLAAQVLTAIPMALLAAPTLERILALEAAAQADPIHALWDALGLLAALAALSLAAYVALAAPYFVLMESSPWQATLGKRALGLVVTDNAGRRLSRARASGRFLASTLSWLSLNLGHALAAWTRDKRALHDWLAGTRVLHADPACPPMPVWGWIVVAVHGALFAATVVALLAAFAAVLMLPGALY